MAQAFQILALHGFTGCGEDFLYLDQATPDHWQWHCPNLPGHGPSPQLDCSPEATSTFITGCASKFRSPITDLRSPTSDHRPPTTDICRPITVLLGYSMGARAALLHAALSPKVWDALVMISPNPGIESLTDLAMRREADAALAEQIERDGVPAFLEYWQATPMIRSQQKIPTDIREPMRANRRQHSAAGLAQSLCQFGQGSYPNLWPIIDEIQLPTLLITGALDTKYTAIAERMARECPNASHHAIDAVGHAPHLEAAPVFLAHLERFLTLHL